MKEPMEREEFIKGLDTLTWSPPVNAQATKRVLLAEFDRLNSCIEELEAMLKAAEQTRDYSQKRTFEEAKGRHEAQKLNEAMNIYWNDMVSRVDALQSWLDKICERFGKDNYTPEAINKTICRLKARHEDDCAMTIRQIELYLDSQKESEKPKGNSGMCGTRHKFVGNGEYCAECGHNKQADCHSYHIQEGKPWLKHDGDKEDCPICNPKPTQCPECGGTRQKKVSIPIGNVREFIGQFYQVVYERCPHCKGEGVI